MTPRRSIAILTLARGEGDLRAAEVIQRAIQDGEGNFDIRIVDALELSRWWFRRIYATRFAHVWKSCREALLRLTRQSGRRGSPVIPTWALRRGCQSMRVRLEAGPAARAGVSPPAVRSIRTVLES